MFQEEEVDFQSIPSSVWEPEGRLSPDQISEILNRPEQPSFSLPAQQGGQTASPLPYDQFGQREQRRSREEVQSSTDMEFIRAYMRSRKGEHFAEREDDKVYDAFMNHMRFMNVNEVTTLGEITWSSRASDEEKAIAANAYDIYNSLSNVFVNDGVAGAFDGIVDYGRAIFTSPSTYLGGVFGRVAMGSASKAGVQALNTGVARAAVQKASAMAASQAAQRGLTGQAAQQFVRQATDQTAREIAGSASRSVMLRQIGAAGAFDAAANTLQDYMYQSIMLDAGVQDDYSVVQSGIAAAGGFVGAGVAAFPYIARGTSGLSEAQENIAVSFSRAKEENMLRLKDEAQEGFKQIKTSVDDWLQAAQRGEVVIGDDRAIERKIIEALIGEDSPYNLFDMFARSRFIFDEGADAAAKTAQIVRAVQDIGDTPAKRELDELLTKELGVSLGEALDAIQTSIRQGSIDMNSVSRGVARISAGRRASENILRGTSDELVEGATEMSPKVAQYAASVWRRALVSHPATTAVNIQGWGVATTANTIAQIMHGGTVGTVGMMSRLASPFSATAKQFSDEALSRSARIFQAESFQLKTLFDPIATRDSFRALLESPHFPKKEREQLQSVLFGGVDTTGPISFGLARGGKDLKRGSRDPAVRELQQLLGVSQTGRFDQATSEAVSALQKRYGLPETGNVTRREWAALTASPAIRKIEAISNRAAVMSAVKLQDVYTKANTFLYDLNRQTLREMGMSLDDVLASGRAFDLSEEMFVNATRAAMERAFSADLTQTSGVLGAIYKLSETLSRLPYLGFIFPFGRFVNNNLHFLYNYSPLGMLSFMNKAGVRKLGTEEGMEQMFRILTGTAAIATIGAYQTRAKEEGLAWNQLETSTGDVLDRTLLAPLSAYLLAGRMMSNIMNDEEIPDEMWRELEQQVGTQFLTRGVTDTTGGMYDALKYMASLANAEADRKEFSEIVMAVGASFAGVASGYTRPLEPFNVVLGATLGTEDLIDRRQLRGSDRLVAEATRYTDRLFAPFFGTKEEGETRSRLGPTAQSIGARTGRYDPNPIARLMGDRGSLPITNINRMLASVDLPEWVASERSGVPELDAVVNERATNILEPRAKRLMQSPRWRDANQSGRRLMVNELLSQVKREVREWVGAGTLSERTLVEQRRWMSVNARQRAEAKAYFGLSNVDDLDLSWGQIMKMREWVRWYSSSISDTVDRS
jgi:peptidoglycan hydrolase-like protein with peptidoglycan-binding domain